jgi:osmotically-inducible protein OsmY
MKKNRFPGIVLLALLPALLLHGCVGVAVVGAGSAALSAADRRTTGVQIEDERIELVSSNRFGEKFGDKAHINITSYNRNVLLTGEVADSAARDEVEKVVRGVPNVRGITNDLQVGPLATLSSRAGDAGTTGKVKARFVDAGKFNPVHVKVVTEASVVYLLGIVTEAEANDAVEVARTTGGVRKVVKIFEYCKATDPACAPRDRPKPKAEETKT